jgi:hypothetical protein
MVTVPPLVARPHAPATAPPPRPPGPLVGASVGSGFRRMLDRALPAERDRGSLLNLLLDDTLRSLADLGALLPSPGAP